MNTLEPVKTIFKVRLGLEGNVAGSEVQGEFGAVRVRRARGTRREERGRAEMLIALRPLTSQHPPPLLSSR